METAATNYMNIALYDHMVNYVMAKYLIANKGHAKFMCSRITNKDNPLGYLVIPKNLSMDESALDRIINEEHQIFWSAHNTHATDGVSLVKYHYQMLQAIQERNATTDDHNYKTFTLLPIRDKGVKFVMLDHPSMVSLWSRLKPHPRALKLTAKQLKTKPLPWMGRRVKVL